MFRRRVQSLLLFYASVVLLTAADSSWKTKPTAQWTEEDATQALAARESLVTGHAVEATSGERSPGPPCGIEIP